MAVSWDKQQRDRAKGEAKHLFVIGVDGQHAKQGGFVAQGCCTDATAKKIWAFFNRLAKAKEI